MESDAPVVGLDVPTAKSRMVKLDIATEGWGRSTSGLCLIQENPSGPTSASSRGVDGGDVDFLHVHHRLEGAFCLSSTRGKRIG
jgi:hypothetical protein